MKQRNGNGRPKLLKLGRTAGHTCLKLLTALIYSAAEDSSNYARSTDYSNLAGSTHADYHFDEYKRQLSISNHNEFKP